ncbi:MAG: hypothetical protein NT005_04410 [Spirochaetes bacterium]|nr:hypothetical protein [Spirochaetota bacterium]
MKARIAIILLATVSLLWACTAGGGSIYSTLENETKTTDNTLKNTIPIHDVALHGDGNYYAAGGRIWRGTPGGTPGAETVDWDTTTPITPPVEGALCNALVEFPQPLGDLYGGFITQSGSLGLYKANGPSPAAATSFASGQIIDTLIANKQVVLLSVVNAGTDLIVGTASTGDPFVYDLLRSTDGMNYASLLAPTVTVTKPFTGVAYTTNKYWAVSGTSLYSGAGIGTLDVDASPTGAVAGEVLTSVFSDDGASRLFVTSNLGFVYYSANEGASWTRNATAEKVSDATVGFLAVAGASGSGTMLVASDGYGYYVLTVANPPTLARFAGSTIGLYTASVRKFLIHGARLFACTNSKGLWRNELFNPADCTVGSWIQE